MGNTGCILSVPFRQTHNDAHMDIHGHKHAYIRTYNDSHTFITHVLTFTHTHAHAHAHTRTHPSTQPWIPSSPSPLRVWSSTLALTPTHHHACTHPHKAPCTITCNQLLHAPTTHQFFPSKLTEATSRQTHRPGRLTRLLLPPPPPLCGLDFCWEHTERHTDTRAQIGVTVFPALSRRGRNGPNPALHGDPAWRNQFSVLVGGMCGVFSRTFATGIRGGMRKGARGEHAKRGQQQGTATTQQTRGGGKNNGRGCARKSLCPENRESKRRK